MATLPKIYQSSYPPIPSSATRKDFLAHVFSNPNNIPPTKPILIDSFTNDAHTFSEVVNLTKCLAAGLRSLGVKPNDVVALFSPNTIDYAVQLYAIIGCGAICSPANYASTATELQGQLKTSGSKYLIAHSTLLDTAEAAVKGTNVSRIIQSDGTVDRNNNPSAVTLSKSNPPSPLFQVSPTEAAQKLCLLCFSSGTTGVAKGVQITHANLVSNSYQWFAHIPNLASPSATRVCFLPFGHLYGLSFFLCNCVHAGAAICVMSHFDLETFLSTVSKHNSENLILVPPVVLLLVKDPRVANHDLSCVKKILSAAAPLSFPLQEAVETRFRSLYGTQIHCYQAWGLTETSPLATIVPEDRIDKKRTVGNITPSMLFRVVDPDTLLDVADPSTTSGEIWCKGPNVTAGYYRNDAATAQSFHDGWFRTGDIAHMDPDGFFVIVDRIKEMIKYKGLQVIPSELEGKLLEHPDVEDACVVGIWRDDVASELPMAFVALTKKAKDKDKDKDKGNPSAVVVADIDRFISRQVANHKRLRGGIRVIDAIPKSASGKILRRQVKAMVEEEEKGKGKGKGKVKL